MPTEAPSAFSTCSYFAGSNFCGAHANSRNTTSFLFFSPPPATLNIFPEEDYRAPILGFTFANLGPFLDEIVVQVSHFLALS